jgi:acyl-coenzyme A thioesterase PaaI-like protein
MAIDNSFTRILHAHADRPPEERIRAITEAVGETIPFVKTAGLVVETYTPTQVTAVLPHRPEVENHVGGLHAAAMALLAETATGLVVALNVPGESVPVIRSLHVDFRRRAAPPLRATATLSDDEAERIRSRPIGKIDVPLTLADATGEAPLDTAIQWAWLPKRRAIPDAS